MRVAYTLLAYLALPVVLARLLWRARRNRAYLRGWGDRLGFARPLPGDRPVLWVHAVSVGEAQAAATLVEALVARRPDLDVLITTGTPTGAEQVRRRLGCRVEHRFVPYDLPGAVRRTLDRNRAVALVVVETELWPNLISICRGHGLPVALVNARLSARSARGYQRVAGLARPMLASLSVIAAQTRADADRLLALGARPERVSVTGSVKFDIEVDGASRDRGRALRERIGMARPVWIAASTHPGEEDEVLDAFDRVRDARPGTLLVLVPRHPERFDEVAALCRRRGLATVRRSLDEPVGSRVAVYLGDTMGELVTLYAAADVAFVGGSLVPTGGHNVLEPAALGVPVLCGPHMFNFAAIGRALIEAHGAFAVEDSTGLAERVIRLLEDDGERARVGDAARRCVDDNRGALERAVSLIAPLLGPSAEA